MKKVLKLYNIWYFLASGFGVGFFGFCPGTTGSIIAVLIWLLIYKFFSIFLIWMGISFSFLLGVIICKKLLSFKFCFYDDPSIVLDEFIGIWLTFMFLPDLSLKWILMAFIFFRFFDIIKPWPINFFDKFIRNSLGIMLDDIIASIYSIILLNILKIFF